MTLSACDRDRTRIEEFPGIDLSLMDSTVNPADDFFRYVNGTWLATTEIPAVEEPERPLTEDDVLREHAHFISLLEEQNYDAADIAAKRVIEMSIRFYGPQSHETAKALINLAVVLLGDHFSGNERTHWVGRNAAVLTLGLGRLLDRLAGESVLACGHKAINRVLIARALGRPSRGVLQIPQPQACRTVLHRADSGAWSAEMIGDSSHLPPELRSES